MVDAVMDQPIDWPQPENAMPMMMPSTKLCMKSPSSTPMSTRIRLFLGELPGRPMSVVDDAS
eukprot:3486962-Prymnesium_polylepis.1